MTQYTGTAMFGIMHFSRVCFCKVLYISLCNVIDYFFNCQISYCLILVNKSKTELNQEIVPKRYNFCIYMHFLLNLPNLEVSIIQYLWLKWYDILTVGWHSTRLKVAQRILTAFSLSCTVTVIHTSCTKTRVIIKVKIP